MLWNTLTHAARVLSCPAQFSHDHIKGYCCDSRLLKPGELFFALKGERTDGHDFLHEVKEKGAAGAVVSKKYEASLQSLKGFNLLFVDDPLYSLQELAKALISTSSSRIVAITGSLGKTSTKEFTKTFLETKYRVFSSPGNSNSQVGLPLAILNSVTGNEEVLVLEMGMTDVGQLSRLVQIAPPEVSVITTIALVHACNFESIEAIARSKGEIFLHPQTKLGILPYDMTLFSEICRIGHFPKWTFSTHHQKADFGLGLIDLCMIQDRLNNHHVKLGPFPLPGRHNLHNLLAAIAVARYFQMDWEEIRMAIPSLQLPHRRLEFIHHKNILFLNDAYNAAEPSMKAALEVLPQPQNAGRKIAVLGSMMELGKFSQNCHRAVGEFALNHVDHLYCLGEECLPMVETWKQVGRPVKIFDNRKELVECLRRDLQPSDVVLLKGSRSKELWKVLEEL